MPSLWRAALVGKRKVVRFARFACARLVVCAALPACHTTEARVVAPAEILESDGWQVIRGVPFVRQRSERDCGAAAVAMVLRYWGVAIAANDVTSAYPAIGDRGLRAGELRDFVRARGLDAFVVEGTPEDVRVQLDRRRPLIVGLARGSGSSAVGHYEVVTGLHKTRRRILTLDPAIGWRESPLDTFASEWAPTRHLALIIFRRSPGDDAPEGLGTLSGFP